MKVKPLFILLLAALVGSLVSAACATTETEAPIKIGALVALTGPLASMGTEAVHGMELALDEVDYEVAGRKIELIVEDIGIDPGLTLTKVRKLNEMDKVDLVLGPGSTAQVLAIRDYIHENKLLTISHMAPSSAMIEEEFTKYFFRSSYSYGQENAVAGYIAYEVKGYRKVVAVITDMVDGHEEWAPFKEVFQGLGGTVVQEIHTPIESPDYGPYMAQIDVENADFVWSFHLGGDAIRFVKALDEYGIKDKLPMFFSAATIAPGWLAPMGDSALGIESASHYSRALDTPENTRFKQAIWDRYQERANLHGHGYVAARMAILALEEVDGDVEDVDRLIEVIENLEFEAPRGPIKFERHTPVQNVYHKVVEKVDGELQNTVIATYPDIGPVWLPEELR